MTRPACGSPSRRSRGRRGWSIDGGVGVLFHPRHFLLWGGRSPLRPGRPDRGGYCPMLTLLAATATADPTTIFTPDPSAASWLVILPVLLCLIGGAGLALVRGTIRLHAP